MLPGRLPGEVFVVCPSERRPLGQNQDSLERLHLAAGVETILCHPGWAAGGWGDASLGFSAQTHAPATWTQISSRKWIDGSYIDRSIMYLNILIGLRVYVTIRRSLWFFHKSHHAWNYLLSSVLRTIHTAAASWAKDRHGDPSHGPKEEIPQVRFCVCLLK